MKINVVIPMAGAGSRFAKAGFKKPKPFIDVKGKPMIEHVLGNINAEDVHFILIAQKAHLEVEPEIVRDIESKYSTTIIPIEKQTEGAACTVLYAHTLINNDVPLLIANSDQVVDMDFQHYFDDLFARKLDGSIVTFFAKDPKWSYAKIDEKGFVTEVKEKECISPYATTGVYLFKKGKQFVESAIDMIVRNERVNNEFYVAPVYNYSIRKNQKIGIYQIEEKAMHGTGTPEDLAIYLKFLENKICTA